jgi:uncharacterized cupredoxin-like copper-binding protein
MKPISLFISLTFVAAALAGCAADESGDNMTTTSPVTTTPVTTPTTDNETPDGPPDVDPRCLAPPADAAEVNASTRLGMPELSFTTSDPSEADPCYRFHGPQNATSGWNVFTLTYPAPGQTFHIMPMYFIGEHTMEDVLAAFASSPEGEAPEWAVPSGAVGGVTPGSSGSVAIDLDVGNHVYFCPIEGHMLQGMMGMLAVTEAENETAAPEADAAIELVDFNFTVPDLTADMTVIRVTNNGSEPHEAPLVKLMGGATMSQFLATLEDPDATGPPPGQLIGGVNAIAPGQTVYLLVDLEAGQDYGMACFIPSPAHGGAPHVAIGPMVVDFTVQDDAAEA